MDKLIEKLFGNVQFAKIHHDTYGLTGIQKAWEIQATIPSLEEKYAYLVAYPSEVAETSEEAETLAKKKMEEMLIELAWNAFTKKRIQNLRRERWN